MENQVVQMRRGMHLYADVDLAASRSYSRLLEWAHCGCGKDNAELHTPSEKFWRLLLAVVVGRSVLDN